MEWEVRMRGVAEATIIVEASDKKEALQKAKERGLELRDLDEVSDAEALEAKPF